MESVLDQISENDLVLLCVVVTAFEEDRIPPV